MSEDYGPIYRPRVVWVDHTRDADARNWYRTSALVNRRFEQPLDVAHGPTLRAVLGELGYRSEPRGEGLQGRRVMLGDAELFVGTAGEVWTWLRQIGAIGGRPKPRLFRLCRP